MDLREIRFKKRLSQWDIQKLSGVYQSRISLIERGYVRPSEDEKKAITDALGMEAEEIDWIISKE